MQSNKGTTRRWLLMACFFLVGVVCAAGGYMAGVHNKTNAIQQALRQRDEADQLVAAKAYLTAFAREDMNNLLSVASAHTWSRRTLYHGKGAMVRWVRAWYDTKTVAPRLQGIRNIRLGPPLTKDFLESAAPFEFHETGCRALENGKWPSWERAPRAVFYEAGGSTRLLMVVYENGGWHVLGFPGRTKASWLTKYADYYAGVEADPAD